MKYKQMLEDINKLVQTDFCMEMDMLTLDKSRPYTQDEAKAMAHIIGGIYMIAHQITCDAHGDYDNKRKEPHE